MIEGKNKIFGKKAGVVIGVILLTLMLTIGISATQLQQSSVVNNKLATTNCHACNPSNPLSFDEEDPSICDMISPIMTQIVQAYEAGNPIGWSMFFPGYSEGAVISAEAVQINHQSGRVLFDGYSISGTVPSAPSTITPGINIKQPSVSITPEGPVPVPPISEYEIYLRASDWLDFCELGEALGDWIRDLLPGGGGDDPQAYLEAVLQCFKLAAMAAGVVSVNALTVILASVALMIWIPITIIQIIIEYMSVLPEVALQILQVLHAFWVWCVDFYYDLYHG